MIKSNRRRWALRFFNVIAALSGIGLLAAVGLWIESHSATKFDHHLSLSARTIDLDSARGFFHFESRPEPQRWTNTPEEWISFRTRFVLGSIGSYAGRHYLMLISSYRFIAILLAILPGIVGMVWLWRFLRSKRTGTGRCLNCGYDLRATPDRCPECGTSSQTASGIRQDDLQQLLVRK